MMEKSQISSIKLQTLQKDSFEDWDFAIRYCLVFGICSLGFMAPLNIEQLRFI